MFLILLGLLTKAWFNHEWISGSLEINQRLYQDSLTLHAL